jgi:hypothetical protein
MKPVTGILASRNDAERVVADLYQIGVARDRVTLLAPGSPARDIPAEQAEQPGMGKAVGGVVGAATGIATGLEIGAIVAAVIPGVGPVIALGALGAAVLGLAGTGVGASLGGKLEQLTTEGLPADEVFVYEDALRKGKSIVIAFAKNGDEQHRIREVLEANHAESVDAARREWWIGLRAAEREHYIAQGRDFDSDEEAYRMGFEAALHARHRCDQYDQVLSEMAADLEKMKRRDPARDIEESFRQGFERGRSYIESYCNRSERAA